MPEQTPEKSCTGNCCHPPHGRDPNEIIKERSERNGYGEPRLNHENLGRIWAAMIGQHFGSGVPDLPPYLVALMMSAVKVLRASGKVYHEDNYDDLAVYACRFAKEFHRDER